MQVSEVDPADAVTGVVNYVLRTVERPYKYMGGRRSDLLSRDTFDVRRVRIRNARHQEFSLDREGFLLVHHSTAVRDFYDHEEVCRVAYREAEEIVRTQTGAAKVVAFHYTLRSEASAPAARSYGAVRRVHNDYTERSAVECVRAQMGEDAEDLLRRRYAIVQIWRSIAGPIEMMPLALCDARTLSPADLVDSERQMPKGIVRTYTMMHSDNHRWFWFRDMEFDEAIVFKVFDSARDGRARWVAHTSFDAPNTPPGARPRESIEIRTLAFFD